jgi:hypothetical protein
VSVIVFVSISFMAASCVVTPVSFYRVSFINNNASTYYLEVYDSIGNFVGRYLTSIDVQPGYRIGVSNSSYVRLFLPPDYSSLTRNVISDMTVTIDMFGTISITTGGGVVIGER